MLPNQEILNLLPLLIRPRESTHKERTRRKTEKLHRRCLTGISNSLQSTYNEMERRDGVWWFYTMGFWWSPQKSNDLHKNQNHLSINILPCSKIFAHPGSKFTPSPRSLSTYSCPILKIKKSINIYFSRAFVCEVAQLSSSFRLEMASL